MLNNFFNPKSIAVIGASKTPGKVGHDILKNIIQYGYDGAVYPINPAADEILDRKAYPSLQDVPDKIDLAVVVIPSKNVLDVIGQCGAKGIDSAIVITAGFRESGIEGSKLETELINKAREAGVRFIGPNCLGMIDTHSKINASFAAGMPAKGNIGFFSQSGALCLAILDRALPDEIGFSKFISMGNKADISDITAADGKTGIFTHLRGEVIKIAGIGQGIVGNHTVSRVLLQPVMNEIGPDKTGRTGYQQSFAHTLSP